MYFVWNDLVNARHIVRTVHTPNRMSARFRSFSSGRERIVFVRNRTLGSAHLWLLSSICLISAIQKHISLLVICLLLDLISLTSVRKAVQLSSNTVCALVRSLLADVQPKTMHFNGATSSVNLNFAVCSQPFLSVRKRQMCLQTVNIFHAVFIEKHERCSVLGVTIYPLVLRANPFDALFSYRKTSVLFVCVFFCSPPASTHN